METAKRLIDIYADIVPDFIPRLSKCMDLDTPHARLTIKNVLKNLAKDKAKKHVLIGVNRMNLKPDEHTFDELFHIHRPAQKAPRPHRSGVGAPSIC
jgi:hypothetical protein